MLPKGVYNNTSDQCMGLDFSKDIIVIFFMGSPGYYLNNYC